MPPATPCSQDVGARLRASLRSSDTVARLGGDEFGILLEEVGGADDAMRTAQADPEPRSPNHSRSVAAP